MIKGLQCIIGRFQTWWAIGSFPMWEDQYSKAKGWIDFFFMFGVLEAKIFQYGFLQEHKARFIHCISAMSNAIQTKDNAMICFIIFCLNCIWHSRNATYEPGLRCAKITVIDHQRREIKSPLWQLNQNFGLKKDILVAMATVSVTILSPGMAIKILCLC